MKLKHLFLIILVMTTAAVTATAQTRWFPSISARNNVQSVFVTRTLWSAIGLSNDMSINGISPDVLETLEAVEVLKISSANDTKEAQKYVEEFINHHNLSVLTEINNGDKKITIYGQIDNNNINDALIIMQDKSNEYGIVGLHGSVKLSSIGSLVH